VGENQSVLSILIYKNDTTVYCIRRFVKINQPLVSGKAESISHLFHFQRKEKRKKERKREKKAEREIKIKKGQ